MAARAPREQLTGGRRAGGARAATERPGVTPLLIMPRVRSPPNLTGPFVDTRAGNKATRDAQ